MSDGPEVPPRNGLIVPFSAAKKTGDPFWDNKPEDEPVPERTDRAALLARVSAKALLLREFPPDEQFLGPIVTRTTRTFIVGQTGTGKTNLGLAMAAGMTSGQGFGHWRCDRPARVLFIDGEMPLGLLRLRVSDLARRHGDVQAVDLLSLISWQDADTLPMDPKPEWAPLNTPDGQAFILRLCNLIRPDVIIFDNVQCLIAGDMKDEVPWAETVPLVHALTARSIGQVWFDHTGWSVSRQYGSATKAWQFDTVGILEPLPAADRRDGELAFTLSFEAPGKARRRTPENAADFAPCTIRLADDRWTVEPKADADATRTPRRPPPLVRKFHAALVDALAAPSRRDEPPGQTTVLAWEGECIRLGLIDPPEEGDTRTLKARKRAPLRTAKSELLAAGWIGIDGLWITDLIAPVGMQ